MTYSSARCTGVRLAVLVASGALCVLAGCADRYKDTRYTRWPSGVRERPIVEQSAAELFVTVDDVARPGGAAASELNFFDELETREEVVNDDALHAILLLGTGVTMPGYDERVTIARRLGWLRPLRPGRPPREAATTGEISRMIVRMMGDRKPLTPAKAAQRLQSLGLLPPESTHYQGMTGAQFVSLLGQVEEALGPAALAAIRAEAHANWNTQVAVDDSDIESASEPAPRQSAPVASAPPTSPPAATQPPPPAETTESPSPWIRGTPLRRPN
ncbi:MAG: hypothetical protein KF699_15305 [Phycisphaeraceae bacterium]|nr:hypothetical protein [Phycisphaeraceae bacterium]